MKKFLSIAIKLIAIISSIYGLFAGSVNLQSFTYFTQLSNLLVVVTLVILLVNDLSQIPLHFKYFEMSKSLQMLDYITTISITVTFLVFALILAPAYGNIIDMYFFEGNCSSFCLHFLSPVLCIIDFIFFNRITNTKHYLLYGTIPPLFYVVFIVVLGQFFNFEWMGMSAPYNFLNYNAPCGWFGFDLGSFGPTTTGIGVFYLIIILVIIFNLIGLCFIKLNHIFSKN